MLLTDEGMRTFMLYTQKREQGKGQAVKKGVYLGIPKGQHQY